MSHVERHTGATQVQWGKVVAGAAIATGAALMAVAIAEGDIPIVSQVVNGAASIAENVLSGLGTGIQNMFASKPDVEAGAGVFAALGQIFENVGNFIANNAPALGGSTLLGGGLAYTAAHYETRPGEAEPALAVSHARVQNAERGFAAREQMRAVNALMQARMQAFGQAPESVAER